MADDDMKIVIEGKAYAIDDFTLGEVEQIEDALGATLDEINPYSIKAAIQFVTVIKRRENPDFTVDDARKLKLSLFNNDDEPAASHVAEGVRNPSGTPKARAKRPTKRAAA